MAKSSTVAKIEPETTEKPVEKLPAPLAVLRSQLEDRAAEFKMVLPAHITPEKLQRTILTAVQQSPALLDCERRSFLTSCMKAAQDGLLPDGREGVIAPFNHRFKDGDGWHTIKIAQYMPMVFGLRKKILQSNEVVDLFTTVVFRQELEAGRFIYEEGTERTLRHKPILDAGFVPHDDDIIAAYSVATFKDGSKSFEVLKRYEIEQIREASQTGAQYDAKGNRREAKGPWVEWFAEMAKKSAIRRHSKTLPMSGDILVDVEQEDMNFAAKSAVALLDRNPAPEPETLGYDPETGEIEDGSEDTQKDQKGPDPNPMPKPEPEPDSGPDSFPADDEGAPGEGEYEDQERDELGVTKDPNQVLAEQFIGRADKCELMLDLRALEREADLQLTEMPADMVSYVDEAFARARLRLTPQPKEGN
jgi:recombination protein RecT